MWVSVIRYFKSLSSLKYRNLNQYPNVTAKHVTSIMLELCARTRIHRVYQNDHIHIELERIRMVMLFINLYFRHFDVRFIGCHVV